MGVININLLLTFFYVLFPLIGLLIFPIDQHAGFLLDQWVVSKIMFYQLVFLIFSVAVSLYLKTRIPELSIDWRVFKLNYRLRFIYGIALAVFAIKALIMVPHLLAFSSREDKFIYQAENMDLIFVISFKICLALSLLFILTDRKKFFLQYSVFFFIVLIFSIATGSRFFLVSILMPLASVINFRKIYIIVGGFSLYIFRMVLLPENKFEWSLEWFQYNFFGDVLNRLVGPFIIIKDELIGIYDKEVLLGAFPFFNKILDMQPTERIVNNYILDNYKNEGFASTPFTDVILSIEAFFLSFFVAYLFILIIKFFYKGSQNKFYGALVLSFVINVLTMYQMGTSAFLSLFIRDFLLFLVLFRMIELKPISRGARLLDTVA
jgi:hypothetical protein